MLPIHPMPSACCSKSAECDPSLGPVGGIHWHMLAGNKVEYIATDPARQKIPWVRMTDSQGVVTVFKTRNFTNDICQDGDPDDGLHGLPQPALSPLYVAGRRGEPGAGASARLTARCRGSKPTRFMC